MFEGKINEQARLPITMFTMPSHSTLTHALRRS